MTQKQETSVWLGNRRYELLGELGEGGFGVVFQALDHHLNTVVALKTLKAPDADMLYNFKREFRALADLAHPNLVALHDLVADDETGQLFFTMELIDGVDFLEYTKKHPTHPSDLPSALPSKFASLIEGPTRSLLAMQAYLDTRSISDVSLFAREDKEKREEKEKPEDKTRPLHKLSPSVHSEPRVPFHMGRLIDSLRQLAQGVDTLHRMGLLHRDLKPSNVLVTPEGRVVILDFGLVADLRHNKLGLDQEIQVAGTPAYMSPEQAYQQPLTEASDWYSVGVILYLALTGRLPFSGSYAEIMRQKQNRTPTPPREWFEEIPEWLSQLALDLLQPAPSNRPKSIEILERIGAQLPTDSQMRSDSLTGQMPLIGRTIELTELRRAFHQTEPGQSRAIFLEGESGIGKSHLARLSVALLQGEAPSLVLSARCYKQESIPYKAMDGLMEQLSNYLNMLPPSELRALIPEGIEELTQIFRVMRRVRPLQLDEHALALDPAEQRRRAFGALRELLHRISKKRKVVFFIDDLQWGDEDSAALLIELLRPPDPPALLFLGCFRSEDLDSSPFLQKFLIHHQFFGSAFPLKRLVVKGLSLVEAAELAALMLGQPSKSRSTLLFSLAKQAGGNPYLLEELIRYLQQHTPPQQLAALLQASTETEDEEEPLKDDETPDEWLDKLDPMLKSVQLRQVFEARFSQLSDKQQELLYLLATAGQPTARKLLLRVLDSPLDAADLGQLRHQHLIRLRENQKDEEIDIYHERHRETLVELLEQHDPDAKRLFHKRLADALAEEQPPDAKRLAFHLSQTGDFFEALEYTLQAARDAEEALAFAQAARWYRHALTLQPDLTQERDIYQGLAGALATQGLGESSADAYLKAAELTQQLQQQQQLPQEEAQHLQRQQRLQAATQLIRCGQLQRGFEILPPLLKELNLQWSHSPSKTIWTWLQYRIRLFFQRFPNIFDLPFNHSKSLHSSPTQMTVDLKELYEHQISKHKQPDFPSRLSPEQTLRLEACRVVSIDAGLIDPLQGMAFQAQHLLEAIRARDPYRLALAYAMEAAYGSFQRSSRNHKRQRRTEQMTDQALTIGKQLNHPHIIGFCYLTTGFAAFTGGSWRRAYDRCRHAESILRKSCTGVTWELSNAHFYTMNALLFMGEFKECHDTLPMILHEAEERGDLYTQTNLRLGVAPKLLLVQDQPERALETIDLALEPWSKRNFHLQHYIELINRGEVALYQDLPFPLWDYINKQWGQIRRGLFLQIQFNRIELYHLRGRCALACAIQSSGSEREKFFREAIRCAKLIEREVVRWAFPWPLQLRAGHAFLNGSPEQGLQYLTAAEAHLEDTDTYAYTHATMLCRGLWLANDEGAKLAQTALTWMDSQNIRNPLRLTQAILPGCLPPEANKRMELLSIA
ncbi:MAG: protein kinase [Myxococcales bacterium]|nr:protein kinase [Myxococcales bacterium]